MAVSFARTGPAAQRTSAHRIAAAAATAATAITAARPSSFFRRATAGESAGPEAVQGLSAAWGSIPYTVLASLPGAAGKPTLDELCKQITALQPTLLHVVCHGRLIEKTGETALYFPKDDQGSPVTATELITRLGRLDRLPHFTFLSTCDSAAPGAENGLGGLGQRLVRELGMPAVLAMTDRISIDTAGKLAETFYARLQQHGEVDGALSETLAELQGRSDVTVPALFSRLGGLPLFSESLNRPLTPAEISYGIDRLRGLVQERAPVLLAEFERSAADVQPAAGAELEALSREARSQVETALQALNQLATEVCDLSFNALCLGQQPPPYDARCPFRGLYPFRLEDREFFVGREALIARLAARLGDHPFLAVLGPSGSGKSSLVLAGLIPALKRELAYLTPGSDPVAQLESAVDSDQKVVVVDQFEELFTLTTDESRRQAFMDRLLKLKDRRQCVVLTMRADFWGEVAPYAALKEEMQAHQELIAPMDADELGASMEQQAARVGLRFEADLSQNILDDVRGEPGAMPLLQHALLLLWNRRHGRWLRAEEYRAIGGVQQAISRAAEDVYAALSDEEKGRVRDIFLRLTRLDDETASGEHRDTRRRVEMRELVPAGTDPAGIINLVTRLADARLLVTGVNPATGEDQVEVAHEALIRYWPRLRAWLEEDRAGLRVRESLREAAAEWMAGSRDENLLVHRGRRLEEAIELSKGPRFVLNAAEQEYLNQCIELRDARERRRKLTLAVSVAVSIVTLLLAAFAMTQAARANRQAEIAHSGELAAQSLYYFDKKLDLSILLSMEAFRHTDNLQTRNSLFVSLSAPYFDRFLSAHTGPVRGLAWSPDGNLLASAANDNSIILWDFHDRSGPKQLPPLQGHKNWVTSVAFSPDGKFLASGSNDNTVILWDVSEAGGPRIAATLNGHTSAVYTLAFSPDGSLLASGSGDKKVILWDLSDKSAPRQLAALEGHSKLVTSVAFSPDGKVLASAGEDGSIILWDVSDRNASRQLASLPKQGREVYALAFNRAGNLLATGGADRRVVLWDVSDPAVPQLLSAVLGHADIVRTLAFSEDDQVLASGSADRSVILWDVSQPQAPREIAALAAHSAAVYALAFSPDRQTLASAGADNQVVLWHYLDPSAPRQLATLRGHSDAVLRLAFNPAGDLLASGSNDGAIMLWDISNPVRAHSISTLPTGTGAVLKLVFSPEGDMLASGGADGTLSIWDVSDPTAPGELAGVKAHSGPVLSLAYSPDGKVLASGGKDNSIILWDVSNARDPRQMATLKDHTSYVNSLAFTPDGRMLASGSADHTIDLWDVSQPSVARKISALEGHSLEIYNVTFVRDGKLLASASADTSVNLWDVSRPDRQHGI
ncbi:MAG TPA: CHAT domain-containing protein, partial [Anaerolineales bacterium]